MSVNLSKNKAESNLDYPKCRIGIMEDFYSHFQLQINWVHADEHKLENNNHDKKE